MLLFIYQLNKSIQHNAKTFCNVWKLACGCVWWSIVELRIQTYFRDIFLWYRPGQFPLPFYMAYFLLSISWQEHRTNDSILTELGLERELLGRVAKLKLQYFGNITRGSARQLALTVLEGIMEGLRHQGRPRRQWIHDMKSGLTANTFS